MTEGFDLSAYPPTYLGPTWQKGPSGKFLIPKKTLGWQVADWCARFLMHPSGEGPWTFTPEQLRWVLWWFALDDEGRFRYRSAVLQRLKGWGKDPLAAVLSLVELAGPSRFDRFDEDGFPVGRPHPASWVEVFGVSKEATVNTMGMMPLLMSESFKTDLHVEVGKEVFRVNGGRGRLMSRSSGHRAVEGGRATALILGETQHWVASNGGHSLFETVVNNVAKTDSRWLSITNAFLPGEDSIAERNRLAWEAIQEGRAEDTGLMYDSIEAHEKTPLTKDALRQVLPLLRGDSDWLKVEPVLDSVMSGAMPPARSRRMWLNQIVSSDEALVTVGEWDALAIGQRLRDGDPVVLGFDGGQVDDATALVAIRVTDGLIEPLLIEEKPLGEEEKARSWSVDRDKVDAVVRAAFKRFDVQAGFFDMRLWESYVSEWARDFQQTLLVPSTGLNALAWDMRGGAQKRVTMANEFLVRSVRDGLLLHTTGTDLDKHLRRHVLNARRRENTYGVSFGKEYRHSPNKVDGYAALVAAAAAWDAVRQSGKRRRGGRSWVL